MDDVAVGRVLRGIRLRARRRQVDVAERAGVSQQVVSLLERGGLDRLALRTARRIANAVGAEVVVSVRWRGAEVDRLRDEGHAQVVGRIAARLERDGWLVATEVTFSVFGERGSFDLLAFHPATRTLLVVEVKTELVPVEETLRRLDVKARLAAQIARERFGWDVRHGLVGRLLVVRGTRTARRQVERHDAVLRRAFPIRGTAARAWLRSPDGARSLLLFVSGTSDVGASHAASGIRRPREPKSRTTDRPQPARRPPSA